MFRFIRNRFPHVHELGPIVTGGLIGWSAWNVNRVTTPKLPPPPRMAQKRSSFSSRLAVRIRPSAVTISTSSRLSTAQPNRRAR
jgi:hypothetical protein